MKRFTEGLERLIDGVSATEARVVLMTSDAVREREAGDRRGQEKNANLKLYADRDEGVWPRSRN